MNKIKHVLLFLGFIACFSACKKDETEPFDHVGQLKKDTASINAFVRANNITGGAVIPETGIFYKILAPGEGNVSYKPATVIKLNFVGRLLDGTEFDNTNGTPRQYALDGVIVGWQIGIKKIQKGGQIRLIVPSGYGFGTSERPPIPRNSILDFTITLVDIIP